MTLAAPTAGPPPSMGMGEAFIPFSCHAPPYPSRKSAATISRVLTRKTISFLRDLEENNNRDWYEANKARYLEDAQEPFREFIRAMEPRLAKISPHILCSDKKVGHSRRERKIGSQPLRLAGRDRTKESRARAA